MRISAQDFLTPPRLRRRARPALIHLLPDLLLGAVAALGLAPFGVWGLSLAAFSLLIWRFARAGSAGAVFWHALAAGIGWFALALNWIVEPFLIEPETYGWMAPFALLLMAIGGALFWALPARLAAMLVPGWRARAAAIPAALALSDWLRGWIFTGFPWALTGHVWIDTPVGQSAAWVGPIGLSSLTLFAAAAPTLLWRHTRRPLLGAVPGMALMIIIVAALWASGLARLAGARPPDTEIALRVVQPNAEQRLKWDPAWSQTYFSRLLDLSAAPGPHDLVIWPETAVNFLLNDAEPVLPAMAESAGVPLILGIQRRDGARYFNSLAALDPAGRVTAVYDKFHLVPFGEYMPWGDALSRVGITAFAAQSGHGYSSGPGPQVISLPDLPGFQPLICYEAIFPQHLRHQPDRPGWLLQITNDGWFGTFSGPYQHLAQARLRSIETGLPLVRAANTGISAVIDAHGRTRHSLPLGAVGNIDAKLPAALAPTPWLRTGPTPMILLLLIVIVVAGLLSRRPARTSRD